MALEKPMSAAEMKEETSGWNMMDFGKALKVLKAGGRVYRVNWNGVGQHLCCQFPDEHSKMSLPYIYIHTVQGHLVPWLASQTDLLAEDWVTL